MKQTNCPNCGAVLKNGKCEYCGTETQNMSKSDIGNYLNGGYKQYQNKEQIQSLIEKCEKSIESGEIERHEGLKIIADLRVRMKNN